MTGADPGFPLMWEATLLEGVSFPYFLKTKTLQSKKGRGGSVSKILLYRSATVNEDVSIAMICFLPVLHVGAQVDGRQSRVRQLLQGSDGGAARVLPGHGRAGRPRG